MMKKKKGGFVLVVLLLWMMMMVMMLLVVGVGRAEADEEAAPPPNNNIEEETVSPPPPNSYWEWEELRKVINRAVTYLFPPKIDFRPGKPVEDGQVNGNGNMKQALTNSFHATKQMVDDSAKAAAQTLRQQQPPDSEL